MSDHQKVIERIRKLLALAQSANENEAQAAALKAQELLAEHNLREADLHEADDEFVIDGELLSDSRPWRRKLAANVARLYFCEYYYGFVKQYTGIMRCGRTGAYMSSRGTPRAPAVIITFGPMWT